ncbi:serine hydrolase domain-containing protein [Ramlibacter sp. PS4R-6]|uniref:serine hydrolase domain-containing protein n=1 Tax=Ramlibacter sp. PS4R-6 TaxID=3133438 RepID=UPI0030A6BE95
MTSDLPRRAMLGWLAGAALARDVKAQSGWVPDRLDALNEQLRSNSRIRAFMMEADGAEPFAYFQPGVAASSRTPVASVTKSIVSLLAGIAIERGAFSGADESLASIFPEHAKGAQGATLARVKLGHVMGMTAGFDPGRTTEDSDYFGFVTRLFAPGLLAHALSRKLVQAPGAKFRYSDLDAHLVACAIARRIDGPLKEFASAALFGPLGIDGSQWLAGHDGVPNGASDLMLTPAEMMRIGRMMLAGGLWEGRQVVPAAWVQESTSPKIALDNNSDGTRRGYGYLWWTSETTPGERRPLFAAVGFGGQFIAVVPRLQLVVVALTAQESREAAARTGALIREYALPTVPRP